MSVVQTWGYVPSNAYTKNTDGTFTCTLNTASSISPNNQFTGKYVGVDNVNNLVSSNDINQMLVMSSDNKYIFLPLSSYATFSNQYHYIALAISVYKSKIPLNNRYYSFQTVFNSWTPPSDNSTYNNLPSVGPSKDNYGKYLLGLNPTAELLQVSSDRSVWSDIGYFYKIQYDFPSISNVCDRIDSPNVISGLEAYDCRSLTNASPIIGRNTPSGVGNSGVGVGNSGNGNKSSTPSSNSLVDNTTIIGICVAVLLLMCGCSSVMAGIYFITSGKKK
jgi:hypothetical protein